MVIKCDSSEKSEKVKWPKIEICKFNGDYKLFQGFCDQFVSSIDNNENIFCEHSYGQCAITGVCV